MKADPREITFRPVTEADLPILSQWMDEPHWQEWWGDRTTELGYIRDMIEGRDTTRPFIFEIGGLPTGYIQYWIVADNLVEPWLTEAPWMSSLPRDTIGVDLSIGNQSELSKGTGSRVLRDFTDSLVADGHTEIIIDPDAANLRAVRAYEKAGFVAFDSYEDDCGTTLLMRFEPSMRKLAS